VIDIVDHLEELESVLVGPAAMFRAPVGHDPQHRQIVLIMERQDLVIEQVSSSDRRLGGVKLGMRHLAIGVDIGLLVYPSDAFERADVKRVLRAQIARMGGLHFATGHVIQLLRLQCLHLSFGQNHAIPGNLGPQRFQPGLET